MKQKWRNGFQKTQALAEEEAAEVEEEEEGKNLHSHSDLIQKYIVYFIHLIYYCNAFSHQII